MQKRIIILIAFLSLTLYSCVKDCISDCPRISFVFSYYADVEREVIDKYIHSAKLFIYNKQDSTLVSQQQLSREELTNREGIEFMLPPGDYIAVCWGNAEEKTEIENKEHLAKGRIHAEGYNASVNSESEDKEKIETNDRLYWVAKEFSTRMKENKQEVLRFQSAHIHINVYLVGFKNEGKVVATNLMPQYDFFMRATKPFSTIYSPSVHRVKEEEEKRLQMASFNVLRFPTKSNIDIVVTFPDTTRDPVIVDMEKFIINNYANLVIDETQEVTINIVLIDQGSDLEVIITIPSWDETPSVPQVGEGLK